MFKGWFKPITKKNALYAAVIILIVLIWTGINVIKDISSGMTFDDMRSELLFLMMFIFIEYAMVTIAFSKDKEKDNEEQGGEEAVNDPEALSDSAERAEETEAPED